MRFRGILEDDDVMSLEEFLGYLKLGMFTDYDGCFEFATDCEKEKTLYYPSQWWTIEVPDWAENVVWYGK
jgi:hypothetical protein